METSLSTSAYPVTATVRDGRTVVLWPVTPTSQALLATAMAIS
jgi:hypothetical protein